MRKPRVAIIGGSRWARVYVRLLLARADAIASVLVVTPRNVEGMHTWAAAEGLQRLTVTADWPRVGEVDAAIVANAAADHDAAAERLLRMGIPVLIEKPFAAGASKAEQLVVLAAAHGTYLAAAQVLRFAGYLHRFAEILDDTGDIASITLTWCDPASEQRYGDLKNHDPGLPLVADIVPHILSILDILLPGRIWLCHGVEVERGGAQADLRLSAGNLPIAVRLARNAPCRARLIEVARREERLVLDFTTEPGTINRRGGAVPADPGWATSPSPLTQLVAAFLQAVAGRSPDPRLSAAHGVTACTLADAAMRQADAALAQWLARARGRGAQVEDLRYAAAEIASRDRNPAPTQISVENSVRLIDALIPALEALRASR